MEPEEGQQGNVYIDPVLVESGFTPSVTGHTDEFYEDQMNLDNEPPTEEHKTHMDTIKNLIEKEPKMKQEIKKIIIDQLVKAKIHPDQYKELSQKLDSLEEPQAIRKKAQPKPRAKKAKQNKESDIPTIMAEDKNEISLVAPIKKC